jgi:hypothetical protein
MCSTATGDDSLLFPRLYQAGALRYVEPGTTVSGRFPRAYSTTLLETGQITHHPIRLVLPVPLPTWQPLPPGRTPTPHLPHQRSPIGHALQGEGHPEERDAAILQSVQFLPPSQCSIF